MPAKNIKKILLMAALALFALTGPGVFVQAAGATFSIAPASGAFDVGETFTATIRVHTGSNLINAAEATLNFAPEFLSVVSVSKSQSIFSLWPVEPAFDNTRGIISFGGGTTVPFSGANGAILSIILRAKKAGDAALNFSGGRILLADGVGTDIFSGAQGAAWIFSLAAAPAVAPPARPEISSPTHPDSEKWYSKSVAAFTWPVGENIAGTRLLVGRIPDAVPTVSYSPPISEKTVEDLEDGVWYFHVRLRNAGGWGGVAHFKFQIDTVSPEPFAIRFLDGKETANPRPRIYFEAEDKLSGISHYEMKIGEEDWFNPGVIRASSYVLPPQTPGEKQIIVKAFDNAENMREAQDRLVVLPAPEVQPSPGLRTVMLFLLAAFLILLIFLGYLSYRLTRLKRNMRKGTREAESALHKAFDLLKEDVREQIKALEKARTKRQLTREEEKVLGQLKRDLDDAEKFIKEKIENIERKAR